MLFCSDLSTLGISVLHKVNLGADFKKEMERNCPREPAAGTRWQKMFPAIWNRPGTCVIPGHIWIRHETTLSRNRPQQTQIRAVTLSREERLDFLSISRTRVSGFTVLLPYELGTVMSRYLWDYINKMGCPLDKTFQDNCRQLPNFAHFKLDLKFA